MVSAGIFSYLLTPVYEAKTVFYVSATPDTLTFLTPSRAEEIKRKPLLPVPSEDAQSIYLGILGSKGLMTKMSQMMNKDYDSLKNDTDIRISSEFLIELYVRDEDPAFAVKIANAFPGLLNDFLDDISNKPNLKKRLAIEREISNNLQKLEKSGKDLMDFHLENRLISVDEEMARLPSEKVNMQMDIENSRISLNEIDDKILELEALLEREGRIYILSPSLEQNPLIWRLQQELADIEATIASSRIDFRDPHPQILKLKAQYKSKKKELTMHMEKITESEVKDPESFHESIRRQLVMTYVDRQVLLARATGLNEAIKRLEERFLSLPDLKFRKNYLDRKVGLFQRTLDNLQMQLEEVMAQERRKMENIIMVSPATTPEIQSFPRPYLNIIVAGFLGLFAGIFYGFFVDYIENVKNPERVWR